MGRLDVKIVGARGLPDDEIGDIDVYVQMELEGQTHKTSVVEGSRPVWNEVFKFVVADPDTAQLRLKLFDKDLFSDDQLGDYNMSVSGLVRGRVRDKWLLLKNCKGNAEIRVRMVARDFGADPPDDSDHDPEPEPQQFGARKPCVPSARRMQRRQQNMSPQQQQQMQLQLQQQQQMAAQQLAQQQAMMQQQNAAAMQQQIQQQQQLQMQQQQQAMRMQQQMMQQQQQQQMGGGMMMMQQQQPMMGFNGNGGGPGKKIRGCDRSFKDFQEIQLTRPVLCATYGPLGTANDVTMQVQQLQMQGCNGWQGGAHTRLGDPAPGQHKIFKVWYSPNAEYEDFAEVNFLGQVVRATYGPKGGSPQSAQDFTQQVNQMIMSGRRNVQGGIHTAIGDPAPGQPKVFRVFYAADSGMDPQRVQRLRQNFGIFDADGSGTLDRGEAQAALMSLLPQASPAELQQQIQAMDVNGDNVISFEEFTLLAGRFM